MKPNPPMPYPGGKSRRVFLLNVVSTVLCRWTDPPELGPDAEYREPFVGGGGALLRNVWRIGARRVWLNDADPSVACVWSALVNYPDALLGRLAQRTTPSIKLYDVWRGECNGLDKAPTDPAEVVRLAERRIYLGHWSWCGGLHGYVEPQPGNKRRTRPDLINLRALVGFLAGRTVRVTNDDFENVITAPGASLIYADPPYVKAGKLLYQRWFTKPDHERLAVALKSRSGPWVLSYDQHPLVTELYPPKVYPHQTFSVQSNISAPDTGTRRSPGEVVIQSPPTV